MIPLVICDCAARKRTNEAVHLPVVVTLLLKRSLDIGYYLVRWQVIITVDRTVPGVVCIGIIAPSREPITSVPIIRCSEHKRNVVTIMAVPPTLIMPL